MKAVNFLTGNEICEVEGIKPMIRIVDQREIGRCVASASLGPKPKVYSLKMVRDGVAYYVEVEDNEEYQMLEKKMLERNNG